MNERLELKTLSACFLPIDYKTRNNCIIYAASLLLLLKDVSFC